MIAIHRIPAFRDNYIWLIAFGAAPNRQAAVVDPGEAAPVLDALRQYNLQLAAILVTHHHADHVGGIADLLATQTVPVYGPAREPIPHRTHPLTEGDRVELGELGLDVIDVPGHTPGHIAYVGPTMLFCGDTLFGAGCGGLFGGTAAQLHKSLNKIAKLPKEINVYCAHEYTLANLGFARLVEPGNPAVLARAAEARAARAQGRATVPSTLAVELETNPFLRCEVSDVIAAAQREANTPLRQSEEVFTVLRKWKDSLA